MQPHTHFLFPLAIGLLLFRFGMISWKIALLCAVVGVLIDLDHYVEYVIHAKKNRFSFIGMWNDSMTKESFVKRSFTHYWPGMIGTTLLIIILFPFSSLASLVLAIAYYSHMILDYIELTQKRFVRWKMLFIYMKESYLNIAFDIIFLTTIVLLLAV